MIYSKVISGSFFMPALLAALVVRSRSSFLISSDIGDG
jgi:hypothetical protein